MEEHGITSAFAAPSVGRRKVKSRGVLSYLRDRWRSETLNEPGLTEDRSAVRSKAIRRCHSQPIDEPVTKWGLSRRQPSSSSPVRPHDHRDVGVQCTIISWNSLTRRVELMADFRSPDHEAEFSSQEISLAATDGSETTTLGDAADIEDVDNDDDDDDDQADFGWFRSPRRALAVHSAPPPDASQSLGCIAFESRIGASTRVAQLRRESVDQGRTARSSSCYSEPEVVRCCSATSAGMAVPRVDVAALRRHFRRRKAITLDDFDVQHRFRRLPDYAPRDSISQRSAVTQQRSFLTYQINFSLLTICKFYEFPVCSTQ